jgi:hypothetical protein
MVTREVLALADETWMALDDEQKRAGYLSGAL